MPKIVVLADVVEDHPGRMTFSERVVAENLLDGHYATQLVERLGWAAADAEALESRMPRGAVALTLPPERELRPA